MTSTEAWDYAIGMIKVDGLEPTKESQKWAKEVGITEDDIDEAITAVRKRRKF